MKKTLIITLAAAVALCVFAGAAAGALGGNSLTIDITTHPAGATVTYPGMGSITTPDSFTVHSSTATWGIPTTLTVYKSGYKTEYISITEADFNKASEGSYTISKDITLQANDGTLSLSSSPSGASVRVDGVNYGYTPTDVKVLAGTHTVTFSKTGYSTLSKTVSVGAGSTTIVTASLSPITPVYNITVTHTAGGNASASAPTAAAGTVVTLTATADAGYVLKEWQVTEGGVSVVNNSFIMPAANVAINAVFETDTMHLAPGWNFVSVPKKLSSAYDTAGELFAGVNTSGRSPLMYDAATGLWELVKADTAITPLSAYWIYSVDTQTIAPSFDTGVHTPSVKKLYEGWNAVGLSAEESMAASAVFNSLDWRTYLPWDAAEQKYGTAIMKGGSGKYSDDHIISLWRGGWVYMDADGTYIGYA